MKGRILINIKREAEEDETNNILSELIKSNNKQNYGVFLNVDTSIRCQMFNVCILLNIFNSSYITNLYNFNFNNMYH